MVTTSYKGPIRKNFFEEMAWNNNKLICGIDEVGRGCLAGPVVAGAVILHPYKKNLLIKDSKLMTSDELVKAYSWIIDNSWHSFSVISPRDIDRYNIYQATLLAMRRALMQLLISFDRNSEVSHVIIDAMPLSLATTPYSTLEVSCFPFGESRSISIAAASIFAKVTRDQLMRNLSGVFPSYDLHEHKGYGTPKHKKALTVHGRSIIHRRTFLKGEYEHEAKGVVSHEEFQQSVCGDY